VIRRAVILALAASLLAACTGSNAQPASGDAPIGTLTVFAASSLTDVFTGFGKAMEDQQPGLHVRFNFAASSALATQIMQGAPADVFASANEAQMTVVTHAGLAADPAVFTSNVLRIAVPAGNPGHVTGLADFARPDLTLALCAPQVPCGAAAQQVFAAAGITPEPDSLEEDARAALTKVQLGEVDAALVYASDVKAAGSKVEGIDFPQAEQAVNEYPICTLKATRNPSAARAFVDLVRSPAGQQALAAAGFRTP
jgi:molybdate transport system substrate-binding protein